MNERDATNPDMEFLTPQETRFANTYRLQHIADGMVMLTFGVDDGDTEQVISTHAIVMSERDAESVAGSILSLLGKE